MATEMVLIPKSTYEQWKADQENDNLNPQNTQLTTAKAGGYNDESKDTHAEDFKDNIHTPNDSERDVGVTKSSEVVTDAQSPAANDNFRQLDVMLKKFPENYRLYARRLLKYIDKNGTDVLAWGRDDNTLIYGGNVIEGTNIIDLITHIFKTNSPPPKGVDLLRKGMVKIKVPKAYLKPYLLKPPGIQKKIKKDWIKY
jgi:hypothetical protein